MAPRLSQHRHEVHVLRISHYIAVVYLSRTPVAVVLPEQRHVVVHDVHTLTPCLYLSENTYVCTALPGCVCACER